MVHLKEIICRDQHQQSLDITQKIWVLLHWFNAAVTLSINGFTSLPSTKAKKIFSPTKPFRTRLPCHISLTSHVKFCTLYMVAIVLKTPEFSTGITFVAICIWYWLALYSYSNLFGNNQSSGNVTKMSYCCND